jgi:hypothetical protein
LAVIETCNNVNETVLRIAFLLDFLEISCCYEAVRKFIPPPPTSMEGGMVCHLGWHVLALMMSGDVMLLNIMVFEKVELFFIEEKGLEFLIPWGCMWDCTSPSVRLAR